MKKALTILFACSTLVLSAQWVSVRHDSDNIFDEGYFINEDTGYAIGEEYSTGTQALILRTLDGGVTWDTTFFPSGYGMGCISIPTSLVGYAGGRDCVINKTVDGGNTWNPAPNFPVSLNDLYDFHFISADTGFVIDVGGVIWKTTDGANTWNIVYSPGQWLNQLGFPNEGNMQFVNDTLAYAALGENGLIAKSLDGGNSWTSISTGDTTIHINAIYMINADTGVAVGRHGKYVRTTNGGSSWSPVAQIPNTLCYLMDILFFNDSVGYMIGGNDYYNWPPSPVKYGLIYATSDGGVTWTLTDSLNRGWLTALHKVSDSVAYCFGWDGRVLRISNPVQYLGVDEPSTALGISVFPNPATSILNVQVTTQEICTFRLYDCLGRTARELEFESSTVISIENLPQGIYYWEVRSSGKFQAGGKTVKQ